MCHFFIKIDKSLESISPYLENINFYVNFCVNAAILCNNYITIIIKSTRMSVDA